MTYLRLLLGFLKIGAFAFGGAYGAIPLIRDVVLDNKWMTEAMFTNMVAVSESTPGPIMVNMATFVGNNKGGFWGALLTTMGVVLPSFLILLLITACFQNVLKRPKVRAVMHGIKPALVGIIGGTGVYMLCKELGIGGDGIRLDVLGLIICGGLIFVELLYIKIRKKELSPICLILLSAVLGMCIYH